MFLNPHSAHKRLIPGVRFAQQPEHLPVARCIRHIICHMMALDDAGLLGHADLTQQGRADGRMMTVDVERVAKTALMLHEPLRGVRQIVHHQDSKDLAEDVEVPPAAADIMQKRTADEKGALLFWQAVPLSERTRRIGGIARVDLVGRMHRVEERQCLRWQVRAHKGVVSLPPYAA